MNSPEWTAYRELKAQTPPLAQRTGSQDEALAAAYTAARNSTR